MSKTQPAQIKLSQLQAGTKTVTVPFGGIEIVLVFNAGFWTCRTEREYFSGEGSFAEKNAILIVKHVTTWNITDDDGKAVPITMKVLEELDVWLVNAIIDAMIKAVNPNAQNSQG